ncbi:uncharacterized protein K452DRAFT_305408 [Aplosporella prunicola CBS 121167]|uniref:Peptidase S54 rhomboid domain-containing protein n=1 Tax=Aplosporella prunicola CBS 121167 TaxID=1176127 RepID=A0A6A6BRD0_9PEZI|nr:uncharacterized protein K452DRAFT_305408 [Aplosporella prunicola CBS 121167]KAF2145377.1 hypothetical protein K452DRAFT_305408 [Aplosporella prunicola CBS 121167]
MSNACAVACRPLAWLRFPPPWTTTLARTVARPPSLVPSLTTTTRHGLFALRPFAFRTFATTTALSAKKKKQQQHAPAQQQQQEKEDAPLPTGDLTAEQTTALFGAHVTPATGNALLRALQHRRITGSLAERGVRFDDKNNKASYPGVTPSLALAALEYLRAKFPVDEEAAAAAWARAEAQRLEHELIARAERLRIYKPVERAAQHNEGLYGYSELEAMRRRNEEAWEREEKEREAREEKEAKELERQGRSGPLARVKGRVELAQRKEKSEFVRYYEEQAMLIKEKEAPRMSTARRVLPSLAIATFVLTLSYLLATTYHPPAQSSRIFPTTAPALTTCLTLVTLNLLVFAAWRIPPLWPTLNRFFVQTPGYPVALSVVGNIFSHQEPLHFFWNMLLLMSAGVQLHEFVGRGTFLGIYVGGGVAGAAASLTCFALARNLGTASLGASGAVAAVIGALLLLREAEHLVVPGTDWRVPVSSSLLLSAFLAYEVWGLTRGRGKTSIDHVAHLGGYATGMVAAWGVKRGLAERRREVEERRRERGGGGLFGK